MPMAATSAAADSGLGQRLARRGQLGRPDFDGIVFDPAGLREKLAEFALGHGDRIALAVEQDAARTGSALVQGQQVAG
jgi:hypothetical protein